MIVLALLAQQVYVHYALTDTYVKGGIRQARGAVPVSARRPKRNTAPADAAKDSIGARHSGETGDETGDETGAGPAQPGWPPPENP